MYVLTSESETLAFTGDFFFMGGVGKFFEGVPEEMKNCLDTLESVCPQDTHMFPGHEYGTENL